MQQVLEAHQIPSRIVDLGIASYLGTGSPTAVQVRPEDKWTALLLLSPKESEPGEEPGEDPKR
jgi:Na+-translocating ferredoxin:NAD+ oxidoreductase RnfC subunit